MKIIQKLLKCCQQATPCLSFEYYPPKDRANWPAFYDKVQRMSALAPDFIDVTWGTGNPTSLDSLEISQAIQAVTGIDTMMHLTCTHRSQSELMEILSHVKEQAGIQNIMALRGNRPQEGDWQPTPNGFDSAAALVAGIRSHFGDYFSIAVAGYPEGHREDGRVCDPGYIRTQGYYAELDYLKRKIDAGADFVITQLCFDLDQLSRYRDDCHQHGITCPIIPGILPLHSRQVWDRIATFSASIPEALAHEYSRVANADSDSFERFAVDLLSSQLSRLHKEGFWAVHLYTLNHEKIISQYLSQERTAKLHS